MGEWSYGHYVSITQPSAGGLPSAIMQDTGENDALLSSRRNAHWKGEAQMLTVPHDLQKAGPSSATKACPMPLRCSGKGPRVRGGLDPRPYSSGGKQAVPGETWGKAVGHGGEGVKWVYMTYSRATCLLSAFQPS